MPFYATDPHDGRSWGTDAARFPPGGESRDTRKPMTLPSASGRSSTSRSLRESGAGAAGTPSARVTPDVSGRPCPPESPAVINDHQDVLRMVRGEFSFSQGLPRCSPLPDRRRTIYQAARDVGSLKCCRISAVNLSASQTERSAGLMYSTERRGDTSSTTAILSAPYRSLDMRAARLRVASQFARSGWPDGRHRLCPSQAQMAAEFMRTDRVGGSQRPQRIVQMFGRPA